MHFCILNIKSSTCFNPAYILPRLIISRILSVACAQRRRNVSSYHVKNPPLQISRPTYEDPTDKGWEFVEAHAFNHRVQILCAISSIARVTVHRDSIKTIISPLSLQIIVRGRQSDEKRRRRRFIQVHVTAQAATLSELAHPQQMCQRPLCSLGGDLRTNPADLFLARRQNLRWPIRGIRRSIRTPDVNLLGSGIGISVRDSWTEVNVPKGTLGSRRSCGGIRANLSYVISPNATALCTKDAYRSFIFLSFSSLF